jgi:hypothetical protein
MIIYKFKMCFLVGGGDCNLEIIVVTNKHYIIICKNYPNTISSRVKSYILFIFLVKSLTKDIILNTLSVI